MFYLDKEGHRITGELAENNKLMKNTADSNLENKTWVLIELMGEAREQADSDKRFSSLLIVTKEQFLDIMVALYFQEDMT